MRISSYVSQPQEKTTFYIIKKIVCRNGQVIWYYQASGIVAIKIYGFKCES